MCEWRQNTETCEGSDFIVGVENLSHMQTAMSKPCIINILLANQREVNKRNHYCRNWTCVSVQIQIYYNIYYYTGGLQFMSLVQQSQRKLQVCYSSVVWSEQTRLLIRAADLLPLWLMMMMMIRLIWACYANIPCFPQSAKDSSERQKQKDRDFFLLNQKTKRPKKWKYKDSSSN